jgi:hypothetical protein
MLERDRQATATVIALAEQVERDSREAQPVGATLDALRLALSDCGTHQAPTGDASRALARMCRVVDQVQASVNRGHVRSISGLSAEARRLARDLEGLASANV